jgi:hypothetical protein
MAAHSLPFELVERSRLGQDPIGNRELAHVMKESSQLDAAILRRRQVQLGRDRHGQAADRGRVLARVPLLELQPVDEACQLDIGPAVPTGL